MGFSEMHAITKRQFDKISPSVSIKSELREQGKNGNFDDILRSVEGTSSRVGYQ